MGIFEKRIADAYTISCKDFNQRGDGCVETALAALGGDLDMIRYVGGLRRTGRLPDNLTTSEFLRAANLLPGLKISLNQIDAVARITDQLEDAKVRGVLVFSSTEQRHHVSAIIHNRNAPQNIAQGMADKKWHVVINTRDPKGWLRFDRSVQQICNEDGIIAALAVMSPDE